MYFFCYVVLAWRAVIAARMVFEGWHHVLSAGGAANGPSGALSSCNGAISVHGSGREKASESPSLGPVRLEKTCPTYDSDLMKMVKQEEVFWVNKRQ